MTGSTNVEQAIYTSARTTHGEGYHLVARSPDISEADAHALSAWCPSHDGLLPNLPEQRSVNFFTLPSGLACISRSLVDGEDYSLRGAPRLVTNLLLVKPDVLARFSYDPFALLRAIELSGRLATGEYSDMPHLAPIALVGRAQRVNEPQLNEVLAELGPARLGIAVDALLAGRPVAMGANLSTEKLMAGLWQCLPVECRGELSFATGLQYSPRRPFDMVALPGDPAARRRLSQRYEVRCLDLNDLQGVTLTAGGWASHVAVTLACGGFAALAEDLAIARPGLSVADLPALAEELFQGRAVRAVLGSESNRADEPLPDDHSQLRVAHAHAAHHRHQRQPAVSSATLKAGSLSLAVSDSLLEKLETLDDAVFAAIAGEAGAMTQLESLWPVVLAEVPQQFIEESQEHYLSHALRVWEHFVQEGRSPERAVAALDVLTLICGERTSYM